MTQLCSVVSLPAVSINIIVGNTIGAFAVSKILKCVYLNGDLFIF